MRKRFGILFAMIFILAVVGCGSSDEDASNEAGADNDGSEGVALTIATVNNPDMQMMQKLTKEYLEKDTGVSVEFVVVPENDLRKKVTEEVALGDGAFDIVTISTYDSLGTK